MDSEYWKLRFELLGEAFAQQMLKASNIDENSDDEKVQWAMEMKEIGNNFYRRKEFESSALVYETITDVIVPDIPNDNKRSAKFVKLVVSCYLNRVISLCTHIVLLDNKSAKGYYRRAQAYEKMGDLQAALLDYQRAHKFEPHDKVIANDIKNLTDRMLNRTKDEKFMSLSLNESKIGILSHDTVSGADSFSTASLLTSHVVGEGTEDNPLNANPTQLKMDEGEKKRVNVRTLEKDEKRRKMDKGVCFEPLGLLSAKVSARVTHGDDQQSVGDKSDEGRHNMSCAIDVNNKVQED